MIWRHLKVQAFQERTGRNLEQRFENILASLTLTLSFFTRFPLPSPLVRRHDDNSSLADAAAFFPIAGVIIAIFPALIWLVANSFLPSVLAAGLAILSGLIITGALHEDGLADCADAFGGTHDSDRTLEIMRDSRIGTYGGLALLMSVGLRWLALSTLSPTAGISALLIAHAASRSSMTLAMQFSRYVRKEGLGSTAEGMTNESFMAAIGIALVLAIVFGGTSGLIAVLIGFVFAYLFLEYLRKRIGGYTGDGLGAMQQTSEITILIALAGFWT